MDTFGEVNIEKGNRRVCYGCAATNTALRALELSGMGKASTLKFEIDGAWGKLADAANVDLDFLFEFEMAINDLRAGDVKEYNRRARRRKVGLATLKPWPHRFPSSAPAITKSA